MLLQNRYEVLDFEGQAAENGEAALPGGSPRSGQSIRQITATITKKKRRVIVEGDSLLRGIEDPVCQPHPSHREVRYLPEAQARAVAERLPGLIQPNDCCPLLVVLVGRDEVDEKSTRVTKEGFRALGCLVQGTRAQGTRGGGLDSFSSKDECQSEQENP